MKNKSYRELIVYTTFGYTADRMSEDRDPGPQGGTQQIFVRGGSAPGSNLLYHFSQKSVPSIDKQYQFHRPCLEL